MRSRRQEDDIPSFERARALLTYVLYKRPRFSRAFISSRVIVLYCSLDAVRRTFLGSTLNLTCEKFLCVYVVRVCNYYVLHMRLLGSLMTFVDCNWHRVARQYETVATRKTLGEADFKVRNTHTHTHFGKNRDIKEKVSLLHSAPAEIMFTSRTFYGSPINLRPNFTVSKDACRETCTIST